MVAMTMDTTNGGSSPSLLLLSSEFPPGPGGIGVHAYQLARHLCRLGWDVSVLSPQEYVGAAERDTFNRQQPFAVEALPGREAGGGWWVARLRAVARSVRARRPDIVVGTGRRALWLAAAVRSLTGIPWAAVGHGSEFTGAHLGAALTRRALGSAAAVIAVSDYTAGLIRAATTPRHLVVIPNAADGARFRPGIDASPLRRRWALGDGPVLLTVGQVSERKAQDTVIRALPRVLAHYPDVTYVMAGLPRQEAAFSALAAELGVAGQVRFAGLVADDELAAVYNLADLFVLMSRRTAAGDVEGFGIVVQEAALCGVPAVVSRDCGLEEAIRDGETGLSAPPDDPEATAAAILSLLDNPDRRRAMGHRAREVALAATWAERVAAYDRELRALLPAAPGEVA